MQVVDLEMLVRSWHRARRGLAQNHMDDGEVDVTGFCMVSPGRLMEIA